MSREIYIPYTRVVLTFESLEIGNGVLSISYTSRSSVRKSVKVSGMARNRPSTMPKMRAGERNPTGQKVGSSCYGI